MFKKETHWQIEPKTQEIVPTRGVLIKVEKEHEPFPQINLAMVFNETTGRLIMNRQVNGNVPDH